MDETQSEKPGSERALLLLSVLFLVSAFICGQSLGHARAGEPPAGQITTVKPGPSTKTAGCHRVTREFRLTQAADGFNGSVQLLQDSRIVETLYQGEHLDVNDLIYEEKVQRLFEETPPLGAVLRLVNYSGAIGMSEGHFALVEKSYTFDDFPFARLNEATLASRARSYLLTCDANTGIGEYGGLVTYLYEVVHDELRPIEFVDSKSKKSERIELLDSSITNWKLVRSKDGKSRDILYAYSGPVVNPNDVDDVQFCTHYYRFHFDGRRWVRYGRAEKGSWGNLGESLPPLSKFPKAR